ncbi:MAG: hypothetical protein QM723_34355 [Myxococcaceae bacterium]
MTNVPARQVTARPTGRSGGERFADGFNLTRLGRLKEAHDGPEFRALVNRIQSKKRVHRWRMKDRVRRSAATTQRLAQLLEMMCSAEVTAWVSERSDWRSGVSSRSVLGALKACELLGVRTSPGEISRLTSLPVSTAKNHLRKLAQRGIVIRTERGAYILSPVPGPPRRVTARQRVFAAINAIQGEAFTHDDIRQRTGLGAGPVKHELSYAFGIGVITRIQTGLYRTTPVRAGSDWTLGRT